MKQALTGNEAMTLAMKQTKPDVVTGFPITPVSDILQIFSKYIADGESKAEFVPAESEHSVASILFGSSASGARSFTCTSSQGLELMHEILHIISGTRLPVVIASSSRALSGPINVHGDHSDFFALRGTSWIQLFCQNAQESYDNFIQAVKIAESVSLPIIVSSDGFFTSHNLERVETLADKKVSDFVGQYNPKHSMLDTARPVTIGPLSLPDSFMEIKKSQSDAMIEAKKTAESVAKEFKRISGREYGWFKEHKLQGSDIAIVVMGSTAETAIPVVDRLRKKGIKAGILSLRVFRPFPADELKAALKNLKAIAVLDRSDAFSGQGGPLYDEIKSALYSLDRKPQIINRIFGLGGREIDEKMIENIYLNLDAINKNKKVEEIKYIGLKV